MTAALVLRSARAIGIRVSIDGEDLALEATKQPPEAILNLLSRHKAEIVKLLTPPKDGWSANDCQVFFEERGYVAQSRNSVPLEDQWLMNTTMAKPLASAEKDNSK